MGVWGTVTTVTRADSYNENYRDVWVKMVLKCDHVDMCSNNIIEME